MLFKTLYFCIWIGFAYCKSEEARQAKIFSFDASKDDLQVGLDFSLPFITIPIKSSDQGSPFAHNDLLQSLPKIHINLSSLIVGGLVFLVTTFISPLLNKSYAGYHRSSRVSDVEYNPLMEFSKQIMEKNMACLERFTCLSSQQKRDTHYLKTMKRIMRFVEHNWKYAYLELNLIDKRNDLLSSILNTTALEEASNRGVRGFDCLGYEPCALTKEDFMTVMDNLAAYQKPKKI